MRKCSTWNIFPRVGKVEFMDINFTPDVFRRKRGKRKTIAFDFWYDKLLLAVAQIFVYQNLPANLPRWELEQRLILWGRAPIFQTKEYGIVTSWGACSGVNIYNIPNTFGYAQAVLGSKSGLTDGVDGIIMYGTSLDRQQYNSGVIGRRIKYYADLLSDIDVSRQVALLNNRAINTVSAKSDNALRELKNFYSRLYDGDLVVPKIDSGVLDSTENILKGLANNNGYTLADFDTAQQNILKLFWGDFGIAYGESKRERMLTDEITAEQDCLDISISDMLACRQEGVDKINVLYGTSITVEVNNNVIT